MVFINHRQCVVQHIPRIYSSCIGESLLIENHPFLTPTPIQKTKQKNLKGVLAIFPSLFGSSESMVVGIFTPWESVNTTNHYPPPPSGSQLVNSEL